MARADLAAAAAVVAGESTAPVGKVYYLVGAPITAGDVADRLGVAHRAIELGEHRARLLGDAALLPFQPPMLASIATSRACVGGYAASVAELPGTRSGPVVRAHFTDDALWNRIRKWITAPTEEGFGADVDFVEDRALNGLDEATIAAAYPLRYPQDYRHPVLFVVDAVAVTTPEHPVLVVNLNSRVDARPFRALPRQVQAIQNNLSLANMDYVEFATSVGADGVFRGF